MPFMDWVHGTLDVAGMVPVIGEVADGVNAGLYAAQGDFVNAGISLAGMIPVGGQAITGTRVAVKVGGEVLQQAEKQVLKEGGQEIAQQGGKQLEKEVASEGAEAGAKDVGTKVSEAPPAPPPANRWPPNRGFAGNPSKKTLQEGEVLTRYGENTGSFASPQGVPFEQRALPPESLQKPFQQYEVIKPFDVDAGPAAPWFGQPGGGMQYDVSNSVVSNHTNFQHLINLGYLKEIK